MIKSKFHLIFMVFLICSCQSGNKKEITSSTNKEDDISLQNQVENNIYRIDENGISDSLPLTIESRMKELNIPGVSIAVFDNNNILWAKGYGLKNKKTGKSVDENTLFQAASISKPVASVTVFKLVEEGKIVLDEDINIKLRSWKVPENEFTKEEKVTALRIMSHTSGLGTSGFQGYKKNEPIPSLVQILNGSELINSDPVRVIETPGQSEYYSGGGMQVLQLLMEDVSGKKFPELSEELIFEPIGMNSSTFGYPLPENLDDLTSYGFDSDGDVISGGYHVYPEKAAAGLWTTPSDLARFMIALGKSYRGEYGGVLEQGSAKIMMQRVPNAGGTGIGIDGKGDSFRFRHSGANAGFNCYAVSFADKGRGVVVMTNSDNGFPLNHEIVRAVSKVYSWPAMWMRE